MTQTPPLDNRDGDTQGTHFSRLIERIAASTQEDFFSTLAQLRAARLSSVAAGSFVLAAAYRLENQPSLTPRERAERLGALIRQSNLNESALSFLASAAASLEAGLRNTIAAHLPPHERRYLVASGVVIEIEPAPSDIAPVRTSALQDDAAIVVASQREARVDDIHDLGEANRCSTVILLSKPLQQEANKRLLEARFTPILLPTIESFGSDLKSNSDVCAVIIDQSFLLDLDVENQRQLFQMVASYSTFLWIRVQDGPNLRLTREQVRQIIQHVWCIPLLPAENLSFETNSRIVESELDEIERTSAILRSNEQAALIPGELTGDEIQLIVAAARRHADSLSLGGRAVRVEVLQTRILQSGGSKSFVLAIRINRDGRPVIAKLSSRESIQDEIRRFQTYVQPWENQIQPRAHFHGDAALVLFGFVTDPNFLDRPAPMLLDELESLWNDQLFPTPEMLPLERRGERLALALAAAARSIREMNVRRPPALAGVNARKPGVAHLDGIGVDWGLGADALAARALAIGQYDTLWQSATVHGDIHLRNILFREPNESHLIDYEGTGPGHPAIDLVRLELQLYTRTARQVESEDRSIEYQRAISIQGASLDVLRRDFPAFHRCEVNVACSAGCVHARDEALEVLRSYGGGLRDYQATKYLVAWEYLGLNGLHTGSAKTVINALTSEILGWERQLN